MDSKVQGISRVLRVVAAKLALSVLYVQPYLLLHVLQRVGRVNRKADENHMGVGVREGTKTVIVLLS